MRFLLLGDFSPAAHAALQKHDHAAYTPADFDPDAAIDTTNPAQLLKFLAQKQWHLFTTNAPLVHQIYEQKLSFPAGIIVLFLNEPAIMQDQPAAIDRLFNRYQRLTPRRLYTLTASRVKIRQLPGPPD